MLVWSANLTSGVTSGWLRILRDVEFKTPLDPDHMRLLGQGKNTGVFDESKDVWALGITLLCYIFSRDFMDYYDWASFRVRTEKVTEALNLLGTLGYPPALVRVVGEALDGNHITRISVGRMREILKGNA